MLNESTILLTGANGQIGWELRRTLAPLGRVVPADVDDFDLADEAAVRRTMRDLHPDIVVNTAAYTAVDRAESDEDTAMAVNGSAPGVLAQEATRCGALVVHYSTDYVFDGERDEPYVETDPPSPLNVYGRTKLAGERAIRETGGDHLILRTSWVYGNRGRNFLLTALRLTSEGRNLRVVEDQIGAPTWCRTVAEATAQILAIRARTGSTGIPSGLFHLTCAGQTSWYGFACSALRAVGASTEAVEPISTEAYPAPARRPRNSVLDNRLVFETFGIRMPDWEHALELCVEP